MNVTLGSQPDEAATTSTGGETQNPFGNGGSLLPNIPFGNPFGQGGGN